MYYDSFDSPLGKIHMLADESGLRQLSLCLHHPFEQSLEWKHSKSKIATYRNQLLEFLTGDRTQFDVTLAPHGTEFQHQVWQAIRDIPYGETRTYSQIAEAIGNPLACRAVGMASNVNPIPFIVPCHRVIGSNGKLTGYRYGVEVKQKLLQLEEAAT
ncbi:methylated-DNA--[protein]-cysteine S-methyltransferase [Enterovibrio makurazakiensis]|uniref:Methylated-DNA--protein-cysteine methyltransferase n=1 Tax=Enterovibrio gelatinilyticus TaxID=2899819 RepID=A0ABT5R3J7_9GAMM|nr:methylated-DNA--[protein]-cysteine S-methyltransferase [Enterovibrio sp. ZSDZ42]MDD1794843.1 methylated-DNA--[protein]-cysteine S-methyltransferase [Enterovibrio sp. ZSDZ42]